MTTIDEERLSAVDYPRSGVQQIDLLAPERSNAYRVVSAIVRAPQLRAALAAPAIILFLILAVYAGQQVYLSKLSAALTVKQNDYRALMSDEQRARLRTRNYEQMRSLAGELFRVRRSVVDRSQEIVDIANVVFRNHLKLSEISDAAASDGAATFWDLRGEASPQAQNDCFSDVAAALPGFLKVKNVVSAVPSTSRVQRGDAAACSYNIRLSRAGGAP